MDEALLIERRAAWASPAGECVERAGWLLRRTPEVARRRSNSALHAPGADHAAQRLFAGAGFTRSHGYHYRTAPS